MRSELPEATEQLWWTNWDQGHPNEATREGYVIPNWVITGYCLIVQQFVINPLSAPSYLMVNLF